MAASVPSPQKKFPQWLVIGFLGLPVLGFLILPQVGVGSFTQLFDLKHLLLLFGGVIGLAVYTRYFKAVMARPQWLVAFILIFWPIVNHLNAQLLMMGPNIHLRPLLIALLAIPGLGMTLRYKALLWRTMPWLRFYAGFVGWVLLYSIFFNANAADPRFTNGDAFGEGSVSLIQSTAYFYCLLSITVPAILMLKSRAPEAVFDTFNRVFIVVSCFLSLLAIIGFPFGMYNMMLDGFLRSKGIFAHPNLFAHHMGIIMVYLVGLFCYYQSQKGSRHTRLPKRPPFPMLLIWVGLGINGVAFLLGLSKTAMGVFALCFLILLALNAQVPAIRRAFFKVLLARLVLAPLALFAYEALSGQSFVSLLSSRIEQTESLTWRTQVWQELLNAITFSSIWFGHGFTAANDLVFRVTFNAQNEEPLMMVHNAYIALIYDLGLPGYLMFGSVLVLMYQSGKRWLGTGLSVIKAESALLIALSVYFLIVCGFDEMSYMFDAPQLFLGLCSMLFCLQIRQLLRIQPDRPQAQRESLPA